MHITAGLYGNNVLNGNQTACRQDIMPDTAVEVLVDRRFETPAETPTPLRNAHGCGYIVLAVPTRLMNQGAYFARNVLVKTCWLTPVVVTVNDLVGGFATIHGRSMQPTLNPSSSTSNDLVLVDKLSIRLFKYSRGDVVLFRSPVCPDTVLIKRLVALEGDWVALPERVDIEKIPQGHCWVEGDNPESSEDSRNKYGPVPLALIEGRVTHVLWPPSRLSRVPPVTPPGRLLMRNSFALKER